jgi:signal transduction histidine kinase
MADGVSSEREGARRDQRWLQLLLDVALIANEVEPLEAALAAASGRVCQHNGWYAAYCHVPQSIRDVWWLESVDRPSGLDLPAETRLLARHWALQVMETERTQHIDDFSDSVPEGFDLPGGNPSSGGAVATPLMAGIRPVGAMVFYSRHPLSHHLEPAQLKGLLEVIDSIGTQMGRVVERWHLARRIAEETERELEELGRQIHDGIAQQLVGVKLLAQNLRRRMGTLSERQSEKWDLLVSSLAQAQNEARAMARGLSAGAILSSSDTLVGQLEELAEVVRTGHGVECKLEVEGALSLPDHLMRAHLLRIAREAVMNALRHGDPSRIDIEFRGGDEQLVLEIRDDGSGLPAGSDSDVGMGLIGMRYRAMAIGGRLELESTPSEGTVVRCVL